MPSPDRIRVPESAQGERLDRFLAASIPGLSRALAQKVIAAGEVTVDGKPAGKHERLQVGQVVAFSLPAPTPTDIPPEDLPLDIVYEDQDLLVVNKPRGMVVHPGAGRRTGTLVNALLARVTDLSGVGGRLRPGIVHRLDKDTSGLLLVAKNDLAHLSLAAQIARREVERRYLALVWGTPEESHFTIEAAIGRHPRERTRMAVREPGRGGGRVRAATTEVWVRETLGPASLLEARLATGRTHQIRVHMAHLGHPVLGDPTYGSKRAGRFTPLLGPQAARALAGLQGQALHAWSLTFTHPRTGERMHFEAPPPEDMQRLLEALRAEAGGQKKG